MVVSGMVVHGCLWHGCLWHGPGDDGGERRFRFEDCAALESLSHAVSETDQSVFSWHRFLRFLLERLQEFDDRHATYGLKSSLPGFPSAGYFTAQTAPL